VPPVVELVAPAPVPPVVVVAPPVVVVASVLVAPAPAPVYVAPPVLVEVEVVAPAPVPVLVVVSPVFVVVLVVVEPPPLPERLPERSAGLDVDAWTGALANDHLVAALAPAMATDDLVGVVAAMNRLGQIHRFEAGAKAGREAMVTASARGVLSTIRPKPATAARR
jgi:hypothetical protein